MGKYQNHGKEVLHIEGEATTHIADAGDNEKAHFLATAANAFNGDPLEQVHARGITLLQRHFAHMKDTAGAFLEDRTQVPRERDAGFINSMLDALDGPEQRAAEAELAQPFDYVAEARLTLSTSWHGDKIAKAQFLGRINGAIDAANKLDQVKKTLFYGRNNNLIAEGQQPLLSTVTDAMGDGNADPENIIHGVIGIFTEAGELLEALRDAYNGNGFDPINMREEIGDMFWYVAILLYEASRDGDGYTFEDCMRVNIAKLRARFPNAFTEYDANNRNLIGERAILEDNAGNPIGHYGEPVDPPRDIAEQALPVNHRSARMEGERFLDGDALEAQKPR